MSITRLNYYKLLYIVVVLLPRLSSNRVLSYKFLVVNQDKTFNLKQIFSS